MSETEATKSIWIVTAETETEGEVERTGPRGSGRSRNPYAPEAIAARGVEVSADVLEARMSGFLEGIGQMFRNAQNKIANTGLELSEIELTIEISGKGEIKLIGSGGEAAAKGAVKLKFTRQE